MFDRRTVSKRPTRVPKVDPIRPITYMNFQGTFQIGGCISIAFTFRVRLWIAADPETASFPSRSGICFIFILSMRVALRSLAAIEKLLRYRASRPTPQFPQASRALIFWSLGIASFLFLRHNLLHAEKIAGDTQAFNVSSSFQGSIFKYLIELIYRPISLVRTFPRASNMWSIGASLATLLPVASACSPGAAEFLHVF